MFVFGEFSKIHSHKRCHFQQLCCRTFRPTCHFRSLSSMDNKVGRGSGELFSSELHNKIQHNSETIFLLGVWKHNFLHKVGFSTYPALTLHGAKYFLPLKIAKFFSFYHDHRSATIFFVLNSEANLFPKKHNPPPTRPLPRPPP